MIIEKSISFNFHNLDEVVLEVAEEIKKGFHIIEIKHLSHGYTLETISKEPDYIIYLHKQEDMLS